MRFINPYEILMQFSIVFCAIRFSINFFIIHQGRNSSQRELKKNELYIQPAKCFTVNQIRPYSKEIPFAYSSQYNCILMGGVFICVIVRISDL